MLRSVKERGFLFYELVKRDFIRRYKRTILGVIWSVLSPLIMTAIMRVVFYNFFGVTIEHYVIYLLSGQIIFNFFSEATNDGMVSFYENAGVFSKINVPKYLFLFSKNAASLINFACMLIVFFIMVLLEGVGFSWKLIFLIYALICQIIFNVGIGMVLSSLYIFFRDMRYLYGIFLQILGYVSVIFYDINNYSIAAQKFFLLNPVYVYIKYFRIVVLEKSIPDIMTHALCALYAFAAIVCGVFTYRKCSGKFLYYI